MVGEVLGARLSATKMARQRDVTWTPPNEWQYVHLQILMDIRDELQKLNGLLHCRNFTDIPVTLRGLRRDIKAARK